MSEDLIGYDRLVQDALKTVARGAIAHVASHGLPGQHHFYLTFATRADGVDIPETLKTRYPAEMTVVLQHRFEDLEVDDEAIRVTLTFDGTPQRLTIPLAALRRFVDPAVPVSFDFPAAAPEPDPGPEVDDEPEASDDDDAKPEARDSNVVSLDRFRSR